MSDNSNSPLAQRRIFLVLIAAVVGALVGYGLFLTVSPVTPKNGTLRTTGEALVGGPFELVDHNGTLVNNEDFKSKHLLVYFGYTTCPDVCVVDMLKLTDTLKRMGDQADRLQPVFISIDPERDTPEALKEFVSRFPISIRGLTGSLEQVDQAAKAYKVYYAKTPADEETGMYYMDHSNYFYLMDENGEFVTFFGADRTPESIAEELRKAVS